MNVAIYSQGRLLNEFAFPASEIMLYLEQENKYSAFKR